MINVGFYRLLSLRSALKLEMLGWKNSRRSAYAIIKEEFGFKGNRKKVYNQIDEYIKKLIKENNHDNI